MERYVENQALKRLPPLATVDRSHVWAVAALFSAFVGERRGKQASDVYLLDRALRRYAEVRGEPVPGAASARAATILRERHLTRNALNKEWLLSCARYGRGATLDFDLLLELFAAPLWPAMLGLLCDGPAEAAELLERLLVEVAAEPAPITSARPGGGTLSRGTVGSYADPLLWVMRRCCEFRRRSFPCALFERWDEVPKVRIPRVAEADTDRSAPPQLVLRRARSDLDREVKRRLGVESDGDELDAVRRISADRLRSAGVWRLARERAIYELVNLLGGRVGAICDLARTDFVRERRLPDGSLGPAIALRPGKTRSADEVSWKPIPQQAVAFVDTYELITDRLMSETPNYGSEGPRPRRKRSPDGPLFVGRLTTPNRPITPATVYQRFVGRKPRPSAGRRGSAPLVPKPGGGGYSPHAHRRRAFQNARSGANEYCREHDPSLDPEAISEALLDHEMRADRLSYADLNTSAGRERLSGIATRINYELLATPRGARKKRDGVAYAAALKQLAILEDELACKRRAIDEAVAEARKSGHVSADLLLNLLADRDQEFLITQIARVKEGSSASATTRARWSPFPTTPRTPRSKMTSRRSKRQSVTPSKRPSRQGPTCPCARETTHSSRFRSSPTSSLFRIRRRRDGHGDKGFHVWRRGLPTPSRSTSRRVHAEVASPYATSIPALSQPKRSAGASRRFSRRGLRAGQRSTAADLLGFRKPSLRSEAMEATPCSATRPIPGAHDTRRRDSCSEFSCPSRFSQRMERFVLPDAHEGGRPAWRTQLRQTRAGPHCRPPIWWGG